MIKSPKPLWCLDDTANTKLRFDATCKPDFMLRWTHKWLWEPGISTIDPPWQRVMATTTEVFHCTLGKLHINLPCRKFADHYSDVIMGAVASQITSLVIVYSTFDSGAAQRKQQSSASLTFVRGIHRWPVNSPQKSPVTRKIFPFGDLC